MLKRGLMKPRLHQGLKIQQLSLVLVVVVEMKSQMEESHAVLQEAVNWSNLETDASNFFASHDYQKASLRLHEAEKSLIIFQNTPDYEHRYKLLTELKNQLEAKIHPQLVVAL